jgi:transcriptional regulator with XRE-family HTH domain
MGTKKETSELTNYKGELNKITGDRVKTVRDKQTYKNGKPFTQAQFAEFLGIANNTISALEQYALALSPAIANIIADKCGVSLDWLYGRNEYDDVEQILNDISHVFNLDMKINADNDIVGTLSVSPYLSELIINMGKAKAFSEQMKTPESVLRATIEHLKSEYIEKQNQNPDIEKTVYEIYKYGELERRTQEAVEKRVQKKNPTIVRNN